MQNAQVLVTGKHFTGHGLRAIGPVVEELVARAEQEIKILAYVFTTSAMPLLERVEDALARGVRVTVVVNRLDAQPQNIIATLKGLAGRYAHATIRSFESADGSQLHAKVVLVDRQRAVIGSANFTWGGMVNNHEIGVLIEGDGAWELSNFVDRMARDLEAV
jgi:phosphatidylserine/phosphatidylglycerophosphate/cardiolipin synthase-like enzyme